MTLITLITQVPEFNYAIYKPSRKSSLTRVKLKQPKGKMSTILLSKDKYNAENSTHSLYVLAQLSPETQGPRYTMKCQMCCYWMIYIESYLVVALLTPLTSIQYTPKPFLLLCDCSTGGRGSSEFFLSCLLLFLRQMTFCLWRLVSSLPAFCPSL